MPHRPRPHPSPPRLCRRRSARQELREPPLRSTRHPRHSATPRLDERLLNMEHRPLGRTGIQVSSLCLGTMMFGAWGNTDEGEYARLVHTAPAPGINLIDTPAVHASGAAEENLGRTTPGAPTN